MTCPYCNAPSHEVACPVCQGLAVVAGEFRVGKELGRGGTGVVYEASRLSDGTPVAVKIMSLRGARDWKSIELFERGTQALLHLRHGNVPACYAYDRDAVGRLYQVRERLDGGTLKQRVDSHRGIPPDRLRASLSTLLRALDYLHSLSPAVVHRDIKPANIMFRSDDSDEPVLVDFEALSFGASRTGTTIVVSPGYTAPEQMAGHAEPASDLYSLGAVMLYALAGSEPAKLPQLKGRHDFRALMTHHEPSLVRVIAKLLQPSLSERYGSAREALADLQANPLAMRPRWWQQAHAFGLGLGLALVVATGFVASWLAFDNAEKNLELRIAAFSRDLDEVAEHRGFVPGYQLHNQETIQAAANRLGLHVAGLSLFEAQSDPLDEPGFLSGHEFAHLLEPRRLTLRGTVSTGVWPWTASRAYQQTLIVPMRSARATMLPHPARRPLY